MSVLKEEYKDNVCFITSGDDFVDKPITKNDIGLIPYEEKKKIIIPSDKQLVPCGEYSMVVPKNMKKLLRKIDNVSREPSIWSFLLNIFRGKKS